MSVILELARAEVHQMAREIMEQHHPELKMPDGSFVKLCIFMASGAESGEPAVKLHGYPCAATIAPIPYKQRVDKRADAEITIDRDYWENQATEPQQRALLDHEITHLELVKDKNGCLKTDDLGRPKLGMRLHDFDFGGFRSIAQRYGADALEVIAARDFQKRYGDVALSPAKVESEQLMLA